jgi:hypothetical protein
LSRLEHLAQRLFQFSGRPPSCFCGLSTSR